MAFSVAYIDYRKVKAGQWGKRKPNCLLPAAGDPAHPPEVTISAFAGSILSPGPFPCPAPTLSGTPGWTCPGWAWGRHPQLQEPKQASARQTPGPRLHAQGPGCPHQLSPPLHPPPHPVQQGAARPHRCGQQLASLLRSQLENAFELRVELSFFWQTLETDKNTHVKTFLGQNL